MLKIAVAQIEVRPGMLKQNLDKVLKNIENAREHGADLIVFPELCITGYTIGDRFNDSYFCEEAHSYNEKIKNASQDIGVIWGNIYYDEFHEQVRGRDGRKLRLNSAFFAYNGNYVTREGAYDAMYVKCLNPDYRVFDESRYFMSAIELQSYGMQIEDDLQPFTFKGYRIGLEICEDLWSGDYAVDVTKAYVKQNCDYIVNISASLWTRNKELGRKKRIKEHAKEMKLPYIVYVNCVGCQNNGKNVMVFDGGSTVYDAEGNEYFELNDSFNEELAVFDGNTHFVTHSDSKLLDALVYGIRKFDEQMFPFHPKWIIGLSGGLDSSVNAALLVRALGNERVIGYNLATKYNSEATKSNARILSERLHIEYRDGFISPVVDATMEVMNTYGYPDSSISALTEENIQARIRGHVLSTFAAINNGVVCNNGNKVEAALGYLTLYGDSIGALCPIGDLLKTDLFELARHLNSEGEIIPKGLLPELEEDMIKWVTPPSAELKNNQVDPMKWYYHDYLIQYLTEFPNYGIERLVKEYEENRLLTHEYLGKWIRYYHLDEPQAFFDDLEWVVNSMNRNVYKRIQLPPNIMVSRGAFGYDLRESQILIPFSSYYYEIKKRCINK